ncbi:exodeoxyribonuclease I [Candidatus Saccharibacteria bacterium]|nr:exodeoxyribonuclease I [Candidatus Saccharibacteria bacterium]
MKTFFFYDLETSGLSPKDDRIMQFAGQRTDENLNPLGEPVNLLVKLADDTLPSPGAIMVTKITPQQTRQDGLTEAEFTNYVEDELFIPDTTIIGYNSVRFDDEFMRYTFWRNFHDPYKWQWQDGRSRWDLLDVVRLVRALRPEGINWPTQTKQVTDKETGEQKTVEVATNRLELLTKANGIEHTHAHDALADVFALIEVAKLIKTKQPKMYDYLYRMRDKKEVAQLVNLEHKQPFVYACGRYPAQTNKTTVAFPLTSSSNGNVLVYDLRYNLDDLLKQEQENPTAEEAKSTFYPIVKELKLSRCPAVAPLGVLENADGWQKLNLTKEQIEQNLKSLLNHPDFAERMRSEHENRPDFPPPADPEGALYNGFLNDKDAFTCNLVRNAKPSELADLHPEFTDERLPELLLHYKAKNFPKSLAEDEQTKWEAYRTARLNRQAPDFLKQLEALSQSESADDFLLEELSLWYQSLL